MDLNAKGSALITGASSGIGAAYADRLARRGYDLILVARRRERLDALAKELGDETGTKAQVVAADLTSKDDLAAVEQVLRENTAITMLVNNAGIAMRGNLAGADPDMLEKLIQLNVLAPSRLTSAVLPNFLARGSGDIINISSAVALAPELLNASYAGTKGYILNLSLKLQKEVAGTGVHVQLVMPGAVRTPIWEKTGDDINAFPQEMIMELDDMVDAALAGFDLGEAVTIPSLPDSADWEAFQDARLSLMPKISRNCPAERYGVNCTSARHSAAGGA